LAVVTVVISFMVSKHPENQENHDDQHCDQRKGIDRLHFARPLSFTKFPKKGAECVKLSERGIDQDPAFAREPEKTKAVPTTNAPNIPARSPPSKRSPPSDAFQNAIAPFRMIAGPITTHQITLSRRVEGSPSAPSKRSHNGKNNAPQSAATSRVSHVD
jgi:hypothetical protein